MDDPENNKLAHELIQTRNELNNIRKKLQGIKSLHQEDVKRLEDLLSTAKSFHQSYSSKQSTSNKESSIEVGDLSTDFSSTTPSLMKEENEEAMSFTMKPIGFVRSLHYQKNGTPRQGCISNLSKGRLEILKDVFNNPSHSLEGLEDYSHVWIMYLFHQNTSEGTHAKIAPPRLDGKKVGVFSTRSPHRPNPVGLTLAKLDKIEGNCLHLSGIDILDGTPALDVKPYIPQYDKPMISSEQKIYPCLTDDDKVDMLPICDANENSYCDNIIRASPLSTNITSKEERIPNSTTDSDLSFPYSKPSVINVEPLEKLSVIDKIDIGITNSSRLSDLNEELPGSSSHKDINNEPNGEIKVANWVKSPPIPSLEVLFNPIAEQQIKQFSADAEDSNYRLEYLKHHIELRSAISSVLSEDPRSTYRRQKCSDRLYYFMVDTAHITTWFAEGMVEVLRVHPPNRSGSCFKLV